MKELLEEARQYTEKKTTHLHLPFSKTCLNAVTFLATGESYQTLTYQHRVSDKTLSKSIPEVADSIFKVLKDDYFKFTQSRKEWLEISTGIFKKYNFPNCFGAMDGKHIPIKYPKGDRYTFYNYKGFHIVVLLRLLDSN